MKRIILVFVILSVLWNSPEQISCQTTVKEKINRVPAVSGSFYPSNPEELRNMVEGFFSKARQIPECNPLALVVPHAGYVFSGEVAASGYLQLDPERTFKHIFIIGPNHRVYFNGINIYTSGNFEMPSGIVPVDPLAGELAAANKDISTDPAIQKQEHCIEVQLPFLQVRLKKPFSIVPILIGGESPESARRLAKLLEPYFNSDNLFIISSDFSHYPEYSVAMKADRQTADAIVSNSANKFLKALDKNAAESGPELATSICGRMPVLTLLMITEKKQNIEFRKIIYKNSGDTSYGDRDKVVGYWAIAVSEKKTVSNAPDFQLPEKDKIQLLKIARNTIRYYLQTGSTDEPDIMSFPGSLHSKSGAFVTLNKNQDLRGCIGRFVSDKPLYRTVQEMAIAAATQDSRFSPVNFPELDQIEIEISVLTPLKRITSISEFKLGRDGIYMKKGSRSGTFLPQVAAGTGWNTEEFLGHCARDKAFIGWDGWKDKDTELYTYQALVFSERELLPEHSEKQK
jgi:AmmeMemoRadiSam system protein B/AmmeMemoRadiSam system protein A